VTKKKDISTSANLIVAAIAGSINVVVTCPLWVANTRLKLQNKADAKTAKKKPYKSLWDAVVRIFSIKMVTHYRNVRLLNFGFQPFHTICMLRFSP
jgi:hypothetical protein